MPTFPEFLNRGDKIAVVAPARKISLLEIQPFIQLAEKQGFEVVYTPGLFEIENQFAGNDEHRAAEFQYWLDHRDVKAIISARGGYGTGRIIDRIDFTKFAMHPKWLIGFSDFTVVHNHINSLFDIATLHAIMPVYAKSGSLPEVLQSFEWMFDILKGKIPQYTMPEHELSNKGNCEGILVGGNLSVIYSMMGSESELDTAGCILFLEDLDEYLYHVDRMMLCLKRAGKLNNINGMIVGHMNSMHDNAIPFGKSVEEIIKEQASLKPIPIYFGFDGGHLNPNLPLIFGSQVKIEDNCLNFEIL